MSRLKVVSRANIPTGLPLTQTVLAYLLMEELSAPSWVQGAVYTVFGLLWIVCIIAMFNQIPKTPKWED